MGFRNAIGLVLVGTVSLWVGTASASNLDLDEIGSLLVLPVITGGLTGGSTTAVTVTNAGGDVRLHLNVISGDSEDSWKSQDFGCDVTASETVLFYFEPGDFGGSFVTYECDGDVTLRSPLYARNGVMVVTTENPNTGDTINPNQIFGDSVVLDYRDSVAYSVGAIPFQGIAPGPGVGDRQYRFDNVEYTQFPSAVATNFIAPNLSIDASLILFTLDGTTGRENTPEAGVTIRFYNDDEVQYSSSHFFDCFDIVDLAEIDERFKEDALGSSAGHLILTPALVTYSNLAHDAQFSTPPTIPGVRIPPVHGWLVQRTDAGLVGGPAGNGDAAWGRTLFQSQLPVITSTGDVPVLNAP
jgi:hypothetical protein